VLSQFLKDSLRIASYLIKLSNEKSTVGDLLQAFADFNKCRVYIYKSTEYNDFCSSREKYEHKSNSLFNIYLKAFQRSGTISFKETNSNRDINVDLDDVIGLMSTRIAEKVLDITELNNAIFLEIEDTHMNLLILLKNFEDMK
jgi:hypothetical protein